MKTNKTNVAGCCAVALLVVLASAPAGASTEGSSNNFFGNYAGYSNTTGSRNVFIGYSAGWYSETGSDKLYIDNCYGVCAPPLIYGEFDNHLLNINGEVGTAPNGA